MCMAPHGSQKKVSDPLVLELLVVVSFPVWVLEIKLWSSARAESVFNH